jgi:hypothetical protein
VQVQCRYRGADIEVLRLSRGDCAVCRCRGA